MNLGDRKALEDAMVAIDGCVNTLVMARIILEDRLQEVPEPIKTKRNPVMESTSAPDECKHQWIKAGPITLLCELCGVNRGTDSD